MSTGSRSATAPITIDAIRIVDGKAVAGASYSVVHAARADKRRLGRQRSRLKTGKIIDRDNRFICDCSFYDLSQGGARVRLMQAVDLPEIVRIYRDSDGAVFTARPVWRSGVEIGLSIAGHRARL